MTEKAQIIPKEIVPILLLSDNPERKSVKFGFDAYARTIAGVIANKSNETPLVIGIYGPWGSGKTTLMRSIENLLKSDLVVKSKMLRKVKTVWFQAWKYNKDDEILAALIEEIFKTMKNDSIWNNCKAYLEQLVKSVDVPKAVRKIGEQFLGSDDIFDFMGKLEYRNKLGFYDTFQDFFDRLLWIYLKDRPKWNNKENTKDVDGVLTIFIDDLDRCPQDKVVSVLETIKLFMDKPGCVFVIGAAKEIIEKALRKTYEGDAIKFMDKIVQVTFMLPVIQPDAFKELIDELNIEQKEQVTKSLTLLAPVIDNNPRQLKRFINNLHLQIGINENRGNPITFEHLFNWAIIEYVYPSLAESIRGNSNILLLLKESIERVGKVKGLGREIEFTEEELKGEPESLKSYIRNGGLRQIIANFNCTREELDQLKSLSTIVQSSEDIQQAGRASSIGEFDKMVLIPEGTFLYGEEKKQAIIEKPYYMDIYPVTNASYERFINDKGYEKEALWSKEGFTWVMENKINKPAYWEDEKFNKPDYPVVGVSYYEAEAYTKWAGKRLPLEIEWERAARGTDGREYPWGNEIDKGKYNSADAKIGHPSSVTQYPEGRSPEGCYDMAGNVWEWCADWYDQERKYRVLRGGCWDDFQIVMRCALRNSDYPDIRSYFVGFRCVR